MTLKKLTIRKSNCQPLQIFGQNFVISKMEGISDLYAVVDLEISKNFGDPIWPLEHNKASDNVVTSKINCVGLHQI